MRIDLVDPSAAEITEAVVQLLNGNNKSELARQLAVSRETLYRWEGGESVPSITELLRLANLTGNEIVLSLNTSSETKSLEQQIQDLRNAFGSFAAGRMQMMDAVEEMIRKHHGDDPEFHERMEQIRESVRNMSGGL